MDGVFVMSIKSNKYIISKYKTIKHYKYWEVTVTGEIVSVVGQPVCSFVVSQLDWPPLTSRSLAW